MSISLNIVLIPYYIQCGVEIYKLGFFIKRAKSQWCMCGKHTTVAFCTELTACRSKRAEARLSFKHAPVSYPKTRHRELALNGQPVKWPCSHSCCLAPATEASELQPLQGLSSPAPPSTLRGPVPSPPCSPWWAPSGILAHHQTSCGLCLISYWLCRCRGTTVYSFFKTVCYVLFKCVC